MTDNCGQLTQNVKSTSMVLLVLIGLAVLLLVFATGYNYLKKTTTTEEDTKKDRMIAYMSVAATVVTGAGLAAAMWQHSTASRAVTACQH